MRRTVIFDYLELACYGVTPKQIARDAGVSPDAVSRAIVRAARIVSRLGFWKFDVLNMDEVMFHRRRLLERMHEQGLIMARRDAA